MRTFFLGGVAVVVGLAVVSGQGQTSTSESLELIGGKSRLTSGMTPEMSGNALDAYRKWSHKPKHFGAFAMSRYGHYGWVHSYNDADMAEAAALKSCDDPACRIVARSTPFAEAKPGQMVVSASTAHNFFTYLQRPGAKAFAVHGNGASGWATNDRHTVQARQTAESSCNRSVRNAAPCQIVHVAR